MSPHHTMAAGPVGLSGAGAQPRDARNRRRSPRRRMPYCGFCVVGLYNHEHRHSGIRYVTPAQRHAGEDRPLLLIRLGWSWAGEVRVPYLGHGSCGHAELDACGAGGTATAGDRAAGKRPDVRSNCPSGWAERQRRDGYLQALRGEGAGGTAKRTAGAGAWHGSLPDRGAGGGGASPDPPAHPG